MIKPVATVNVVPDVPKPLERITDLVYNLRWAWDLDTITLFRRIDSDLWLKTRRNPVGMLGLVSQERLNACINDPAFMAHYHRALTSFDEYMAAKDTWYEKHYGHMEKPIIAYFSMEFGITECLQNYSGGLGVLSGDHLKSSSDLGLPLVGVGLLYQEGYFQQYLNADGYQQESYPLNDYSTLPVTLQRDTAGHVIKLQVPLPGRQLTFQIWKAQVGRVPLFLLDTNIPENTLEEDRNLTDRLYGGDRRTRIRQEILLGIGGVRTLDVMGLRPTICHMNEGHSAFLIFERIRQLIQERQFTLDQAREIVKASSIFTTHTMVPAGLERFGFDLIDEHFTDFYRSMGLTREQFIDLGRENMGTYQLFSMPVMALNFSSWTNGVARLHGEVSRGLWQWVYPNLPEKEVPVGSITNGVHMNSWVSGEIATLFDRYLDPAWRVDESNPDVWKEIDNVPDSELWRTHERRRERLVAFARQHLRQQLERAGASQRELEKADEVLNPDALTIGFARRFATYKRATLVMQDIERLKRLVNDPNRPVQFIFAGKAHPHDEGGKALIREIVKHSQREELRHSVVFLENYDMMIARYMVQGVDVWLNTPRRPNEASGTSGMKVIYNGGLNVSILDGWWDEGYSPEVGWAIGNGEEYSDEEAQHGDYVESQALYNLLEQDVIPLFYNHGRDGLPREWIAKVKASIRRLAPVYSTHRMIKEYTEKYYIPTVEHFRQMTVPDFSKALDFIQWRTRLQNAWRQIRVQQVEVTPKTVKVRGDVTVEASVYLGDLTPADVSVQLYFGELNTRGQINDGDAVEMSPVSQTGENKVYRFSTSVQYSSTGDRGLSVRVVPKHEFLSTPFQPGLITWA
jgi:starch phosphorylase